MKTQRVTTQTGFKTILGLLMIFLAIFQACSDKDNPRARPSDSFDVIVHQPAADTTYGPGDTVWISAEIKARHNLHEYYVELLNANTEERVFLSHKHLHTTNHVHIDTFWVNDLLHDSPMRLALSASDHEGGAIHDSTSFSCHTK